jgi:hypothetical protein
MKKRNFKSFGNRLRKNLKSRTRHATDLGVGLVIALGSSFLKKVVQISVWIYLLLTMSGVLNSSGLAIYYNPHGNRGSLFSAPPKRPPRSSHQSVRGSGSVPPAHGSKLSSAGSSSGPLIPHPYF